MTLWPSVQPVLVFSGVIFLNFSKEMLRLIGISLCQLLDFSRAFQLQWQSASLTKTLGLEGAGQAGSEILGFSASQVYTARALQHFREHTLSFQLLRSPNTCRQNTTCTCQDTTALFSEAHRMMRLKKIDLLLLWKPA